MSVNLMSDELLEGINFVASWGSRVFDIIYLKAIPSKEYVVSVLENEVCLERQ